MWRVNLGPSLPPAFWAPVWTLNSKGISLEDEEVFLTLAVNTNPVQTIEGKCRVVTEAQWAGERAEEGKRKKAPARQETFVCRRALIGAPPGEKKKKPSGKAADSWAKAAVAGMFAPVTFEQGVGFRAVLPSANKGKAKKGKGKR